MSDDDRIDSAVKNAASRSAERAATEVREISKTQEAVAALDGQLEALLRCDSPLTPLAPRARQVRRELAGLTRELRERNEALQRSTEQDEKVNAIVAAGQEVAAFIMQNPPPPSAGDEKRAAIIRWLRLLAQEEPEGVHISEMCLQDPKYRWKTFLQGPELRGRLEAWGIRTEWVMVQGRWAPGVHRYTIDAFDPPSDSTH